MTRDTRSPDPRRAELDAARLLLDRMGITAADLLTLRGTPNRPDVRRLHPPGPQVRDAVATPG